MDYVVAIPTYQRADILEKKTLNTLQQGKVAASRIYLFVANEQERQIYEERIPKEKYHQLVIGKKGIANQRIFITQYFKEGKRVVSMDDDVEAVEKLSNGKLVKISDLDAFFREAFRLLVKEGAYLWGIYPVRNPFFMKPTQTTHLTFVIGVLRGFINRKTNDLHPNTRAEGKEDYEQSILYWKKDGKVLRFNNVTIKTKFNAKGGLGQERKEMNRLAATYLKETYPDIITIFHRKSGMTEVKLAALGRPQTRKRIKKK